MEFGLPLTGLEKLEETVGLPDFSGPMTDEDYIVNQQTHFHEHFASQIVLRRLSANFHSVLNKSTSKERCTSSLSNRTLTNSFKPLAKMLLCPLRGSLLSMSLQVPGPQLL
jgi:hypothetical protein